MRRRPRRRGSACCNRAERSPRGQEASPHSAPGNGRLARRVPEARPPLRKNENPTGSVERGLSLEPAASRRPPRGRPAWSLPAKAFRGGPAGETRGRVSPTLSHPSRAAKTARSSFLSSDIMSRRIREKRGAETCARQRPARRAPRAPSAPAAATMELAWQRRRATPARSRPAFDCRVPK